MDKNTTIYSVFALSGYGGAGAAPESLITNEDVLRKLQSECSGVDLVARDLTKPDTFLESALNELEDTKEGLDGVLIIGASREYKIAFTGLPTIVAYNPFNG